MSTFQSVSDDSEGGALVVSSGGDVEALAGPLPLDGDGLLALDVALALADGSLLPLVPRGSALPASSSACSAGRGSCAVERRRPPDAARDGARRRAAARGACDAPPGALARRRRRAARGLLRRASPWNSSSARAGRALAPEGVGGDVDASYTASRVWPAAYELARHLEGGAVAGGVPSPAARALPRAAAPCAAAVVLSDLPENLPLLERNAKRSGAAGVAVVALDWLAPDLPEDLPPADVVLAADCVFWPHLFDPLLDTLGRLRRRNPDATLLISCTHRLGRTADPSASRRPTSSAKLAAAGVELPADRPIVTHCGSGGRGGKAAAILQGLGYDAHNGGSPVNVAAALAIAGATSP
ncbi:lysine N-methyltransferase [Aureococcus anophagefferens]|nr:lysine N-methyltransferase [Aureococcus anophagefferens]